MQMLMSALILVSSFSRISSRIPNTKGTVLEHPIVCGTFCIRHRASCCRSSNCILTSRCIYPQSRTARILDANKTHGQPSDASLLHPLAHNVFQIMNAIWMRILRCSPMLVAVREHSTQTIGVVWQRCQLYLASTTHVTVQSDTLLHVPFLWETTCSALYSHAFGGLENILISQTNLVKPSCDASFNGQSTRPFLQ